MTHEQLRGHLDYMQRDDASALGLIGAAGAILEHDEALRAALVNAEVDLAAVAVEYKCALGSIEALGTGLAAALAEVDRLRGVLQRVLWAQALPWAGQAECYMVLDVIRADLRAECRAALSAPCEGKGEPAEECRSCFRPLIQDERDVNGDKCHQCADEDEVVSCDECGHPPAVGNVVYEDSGRRPLCRTCSRTDGGPSEENR